MSDIVAQHDLPPAVLRRLYGELDGHIKCDETVTYDIDSGEWIRYFV